MHLFLNKKCNKYDINISQKYINNTHIQLSKENAEHNFSNSFHDISDTVKSCIKCDYVMAGHAIVVVKDKTLLFYHGNAIILTLW